MKVRLIQPDPETEKALSARFGLHATGQDWDLANADPSKLDQFMEYFTRCDQPDELYSLCNLIIASIDKIEEEEKRKKRFAAASPKILENGEFFLSTLVYWAVLGTGEDEDYMFAVSPAVRDILNAVTGVSSLKITDESYRGILLDGTPMEDLLFNQYPDVSFEELIEECTEPCQLHLSDDDPMEIEVLDDVVFWYLYGEEENYLFKFDKKEYTRVVRAYKD